MAIRLREIAPAQACDPVPGNLDHAAVQAPIAAPGGTTARHLGFQAIDDLAASLGAQVLAHGHHHRAIDYVYEGLMPASAPFRAFGVDMGSPSGLAARWTGPAVILFLDIDGVLHLEGEGHLPNDGTDFFFMPRLEALLRTRPVIPS